MSERLIERYSAMNDLQERWGGWRVVVAHLDGCNEEIHRQSQLILIGEVDDHEWAVAHAVAHLDLDHKGAQFSASQEHEADWLAGVRLDVEWDDLPMDGEPTVDLPRS